jgi:putative acetyltransferase
MKITLRHERPGDEDAVRQVHRAAFPTEDEARLVDALRDGGHARVSLVAEEEGRIVGHVLFSDLAIGAEAVGALALAPVAVLPARQRRGVGSRLIREGMEECRRRGHRIVVVLGHADYYPRFGFSAELAKPLRSPFSGPHWMAAELVPGALAGVEGPVRYAPPFGLA